MAGHSMKQAKNRSALSRFGGYLSIPHELLHVVGYRLVGKQCSYQWGDFRVTPLGSMTLWERLVGLLFPFGVFSIFCFVSGILSGLAYSYGLREGSFIWFIFLTGVALISGSYAGTAIGDLRKAYLLILNKPWHSWTPFDIFFWPVVDWSEVRKKIATEEQDDKQS